MLKLFACCVIFCAFIVGCWLFSKSTFSKSSFRNIIKVTNILDPDQAQNFIEPDLSPNCLQRLSADDTNRQRVNMNCKAIHVHVNELPWPNNSPYAYPLVLSIHVGPVLKIFLIGENNEIKVFILFCFRLNCPYFQTFNISGI